MNDQEKRTRTAQAFDIFKALIVAKGTEWDFDPVAQKAFDAVEAFHQIAQRRYGLAQPQIHTTTGVETAREAWQQNKPPSPGMAVQGPEGLS